MNRFTQILSIVFLLYLGACQNTKNNLPRIAFLDYVDDATLAQARMGFKDALLQKGFVADSNYVFDYLNAQGDQPTLVQACQQLLSKQPLCIATCPTLATITAVQNTTTVPVIMMVSPEPKNAGLVGANGLPPNVGGVYETLSYIDTSVLIIKTLMPSVKILGLMYNAAEPQSVNALEVIKLACQRYNLQLEALPVSNSSEAQMVTQALLQRNIDVFFAMPDNILFQTFETVAESCNKKNVPIFTSEAGLVSRGAVAAYGADMYAWGFQAGQQAVALLLDNKIQLKPEVVKLRKRIYNVKQAAKFGITPDTNFEALKH
ncbi:MAG: ABC transporter substrate-binding protein [Bacteroidia bacterium]|nr:ABC transporter substrate-binding protein [Bacteroidia bacterium]